MAINFQPLVAESLAKQIAENIRSSILDGSLKADDQLPTEEVLAEKFNVSRPTIREALKRLAAQNLIRSRRGPAGGTFVNRPSQEDLSSSLTGAAMLLVSMGEFSLSEIAEARRELQISVLEIAKELHLDEPKVRAIVQGIQDTADALNITTLAEFVENARTEAILKEIGVHWAQGYYYGKPAIVHQPGLSVAPGCPGSRNGTSGFG